MGKIKNIVLRILKWVGIFVASILFLMFIIPLLFPGTILSRSRSLQIKAWPAN